LVVIINSLKVPKIKKILLYEMKFLVPNYSCLQNPWLGGYHPQIPVLSVLCHQLNLLNPPPPEQNYWVRHCHSGTIHHMTIYYATSLKTTFNFFPEYGVWKFTLCSHQGPQLFIMVTLMFNSFWIALYLLTSRKTGWYNIQALIQFCFRSIFSHASLSI